MRKLIVSCMLLASATAVAAPTTLEVVKTKPSASEAAIRGAHQEILTPNSTLAKNRTTIFLGLKQENNLRWLVEAEGEGYVVARGNLKGHIMVLKIEYNSEMIQIKYLDGDDSFECENLLGDICYENHRRYFGFVKRLRTFITRYI
jgi:hypothetical protein